MDDNTSTTPGPDPTPAPVQTRKHAAAYEAPKGTPGSGRFAAYDTTYGRYVGGVHPNKGDVPKSEKGQPAYKVVEV